MASKKVAVPLCAVLALGLSPLAQALDSACIRFSDVKFSAASPDLTLFHATSEARTVSVIVGMRGDVQGAALASSLPGRVIHALPLVQAFAMEVPAASLATLAKNPLIRILEIDGKVTIDDPIPQTTTSGDPVTLTEQVTPPGVARVGAPLLWSKSTGKGVKVAVIDTGIDKNHPDLAERVLGGRNFSSDEREDWNDGHGHGTHVAGTIAADNNAIGVVGVAPEASLVAVRVLDEFGSGTYSDVIAGVDYAVSEKVDIANMSLGGTEDNQILHEALRKAHENGVLVVAAAGNSGDEIRNPLNFPGAYPEVVSVAAVDDKDLRAYFSTYNKFVALAAPGVSVLSLDKGGDKYVKHSGTSMATPHVAGAAALLKALYANESVTALKRRLVCNAEDSFPNGRDQWTGHGIVDAKLAFERSVPATCSYLSGDVTEPTLEEPSAKPAPAPGISATYVKTMGLKLVNDGQKKQLLITARIVDQNDTPQAKVKVTSEVLEYGIGPLGQATATTNAEGDAQFILKGFKCGRYMASIKQASAPAFTTEYGQTAVTIDLGNASTPSPDLPDENESR